MMHIGDGKRDQWEFEYTAAKLAEGAIAQREFRRGRAAWWANAKDQLMTEIRQSGLEVSESVAAGISNYTGTRMEGPQVMVRADLQKKLSECHAKIQSHQQAADEYEGWVQVLKANSENRLKLTQADWLYFFGAH